jgi:hypothetical protein
MSSHRRLGIALLALVWGCSSAGGDGSLFNGGGGGGGSGGGANTGGTLNLSGSGGGVDIDPPCGQVDDGVDRDGDGFNVGQGDCNDCSPQMNPGAYDYPGNGVDEDCNQTVDDEPFGCDTGGFPLDGNDPMDAVKAMGLCKFTSASGPGWGVISAKYVFADGSSQSQAPGGFPTCTGQGGPGAPPNAMSHGVLPTFGKLLKPREGQSMVALSSGVARQGVNGDSPGGAQMCTKSGTPSGFPTPSKEACPNTSIDDSPIAFDPMALEIEMRAPTNAKSIAFDFNFYTYEFPTFVCTQYNDFFVALLYSAHPSTPQNKNISFDAKNNPVSVNNGFLEVCKPQTAGKKQFACMLGTDELLETGFETHAATGWLQTSASIQPGETFRIRFAIWDMGDEVLDSTVLIDNFRFDVNEGQNQTVRPPPK